MNYGYLSHHVNAKNSDGKPSRERLFSWTRCRPDGKVPAEIQRFETLDEPTSFRREWSYNTPNFNELLELISNDFGPDVTENILEHIYKENQEYAITTKEKRTHKAELAFVQLSRNASSEYNSLDSSYEGNEQAYHDFINRFGDSVIRQVTLGEREIVIIILPKNIQLGKFQKDLDSSLDKSDRIGNTCHNKPEIDLPSITYNLRMGNVSSNQPDILQQQLVPIYTYLNFNDVTKQQSFDKAVEDNRRHKNIHQAFQVAKFLRHAKFSQVKQALKQELQIVSPDQNLAAIAEQFKSMEPEEADLNLKFQFNEFYYNPSNSYITRVYTVPLACGICTSIQNPIDGIFREKELPVKVEMQPKRVCVEAFEEAGCIGDPVTKSTRPSDYLPKAGLYRSFRPCIRRGNEK